MKQVVINGGETYGDILTPYWIIKYLERKDIKVFAYNQEVGMEDTWEYTLVKDIETLDEPKEIYTITYLTKNVGDFLLEEEWNNLEFNESDIIDIYDLFEDREDSDLIEIAKEIDNKDLIKVVEIPADVKYEIHQSECGFNEWIQEVSRTWY